MDETKIQWCIDQHKATNHFYDKYLPYEFHLRMVAQVAEDFIHLPENQWSELKVACWGHDLIEDTRASYNDCRNVLGEYVADIIYACTNEKGKSRAERANEKYYLGIRETPGATFVKLCDRIANIKYSIDSGSSMLNKYKAEHAGFSAALNTSATYHSIWGYMESLLCEAAI